MIIPNPIVCIYTTPLSQLELSPYQTVFHTLSRTPSPFTLKHVIFQKVVLQHMVFHLLLIHIIIT